MDNTAFIFHYIFEYGFITLCLIGDIVIFLYEIYDRKKCRKEHPECPLTSCFSCITPRRHMLTEEEREELRKLIAEQD